MLPFRCGFHLHIDWVMWLERNKTIFLLWVLAVNLNAFLLGILCIHLCYISWNILAATKSPLSCNLFWMAFLLHPECIPVLGIFNESPWWYNGILISIHVCNPSMFALSCSFLSTAYCNNLLPITLSRMVCADFTLCLSPFLSSLRLLMINVYIWTWQWSMWKPAPASISSFQTFFLFFGPFSSAFMLGLTCSG